MVLWQIFPVKPVFGVITKMAAILTGSRYHLTESTLNLACKGQNDDEIVCSMLFRIFMSHKKVIRVTN